MNHRRFALYSAEQTRQLDATAINRFGIAGFTLMCRAGEFSFNTLMTVFPRVRRLVVVCGIGNNGGDGYVIARLAHQIGVSVSVMQLGEPTSLQGDAYTAYTAMQQQGLTTEPFSVDGLASADIIVDAIFGTGLERPITGNWADAINAMNQSAKPIVAIDIPSGLHANTGAVLGVAVQAHLTTTFIGDKRGLYTAKGPALCGDIFFNDLGVPPEVYDEVEIKTRRWDASQTEQLRPRPRNAHKGTNGHALLIGGEVGFSGAIRLSGEACLRTGAGLSSIATRAAHAAVIAQARPELMCHGVEDLEALDALLLLANAFAIGPGLAKSDWGRAMFQKTIKSEKPMIVDADALNLLSESPHQRQNWILTPHPGEAARLLECTIQDIESDRFASCELLHRRYGGICVLKGSGTLITDGDTTIVCDKGNPGMASGGSGDVLTGILAGLLVQFPAMSLFEIAQLGVGIHAMAGDAAAKDGERGMIASDMMPMIRGMVNRVSIT